MANSTARRFLVTTKLPAFTYSRSVGDAKSGDLDGYVPHDIMPGEVLKRVCVLDPSSADPDFPALVRQNGPCLECLDEKDEEVLIPLSRRAMIFEIAEVYPDDMERVFSMAQVVAAGNAKLPRVMKLAHGDPPLLAYAFTGMLRCYTVFTEETILAATLDDATSICLELATDSLARFRLCLNEAAVKRTCEYGNALYKCDTFGEKFINGIKVSFSLQPELSELDDIDLSYYESQNSFSDMQEVEANSEFEISWGAVKKAKLLRSVSDGHREISKREESSGEDDSFLEGVPEFSASEKGENVNNKSKISAIVTKTGKRSVSDSSLQQQREFTEKDIADLMQRKGMIATAGYTEENRSGPQLDEDKVRHNPLYYYFQREAEEERNSSRTEIQLSKSEEAKDGAVNKVSFDNLETCVDKDVESSAENLPDLIANPIASNDQNESVDLDASMFEQSLCTPAREYSEDEVVDSESSESDNDSDILYDQAGSGNSKQSYTSVKTKTQVPIEAKVVVKPMDKSVTRTRAYKASALQGNNNDTSSSDDVSTDRERLGKSKLDSGIHVKHRQSRTSALFGEDALRRLSGTEEKSSHSLVEPNGNERNFLNRTAITEDESFTPLMARPPKPTFTEVDDPLESTMSELDKVTSIKPSSLITNKNDVEESLHDSTGFHKRLSFHSNVLGNTNLANFDRNAKMLLQWKSENDISGSVEGNINLARREMNLLKQRPEPLKRSLRPLANQGPNKKHADVMQEEDRFDSPRVSHHPHVHPHTSALQHNPPGVLHLGHWTKPVPLGGVPTDKDFNDNGPRFSQPESKVLNSVQSFEQLSSSLLRSAGADSSANTNSTGHNPALIFTSRNSKKVNNDREDVMNDCRKSNTDINTHQPNNVVENREANKKENALSTDFSQNVKSCVTSKHEKPEAYQIQTKLVQETDSDEDVTTIEEHFVVSTDAITSPGKNLKVLPVYQEDLNCENYV